MREFKKPEHQLCWDCKNALGGCAWSDKGKPVKGWTAEKTQIKGGHFYGGRDTYYITACPQFERDSYGYGMYREPRYEPEPTSDDDGLPIAEYVRYSTVKEAYAAVYCPSCGNLCWFEAPRKKLGTRRCKHAGCQFLFKIRAL